MVIKNKIKNRPETLDLALRAMKIIERVLSIIEKLVQP